MDDSGFVATPKNSPKEKGKDNPSMSKLSPPKIDDSGLAATPANSPKEKEEGDASVFKPLTLQMDDSGFVATPNNSPKEKGEHGDASVRSKLSPPKIDDNGLTATPVNCLKEKGEGVVIRSKFLVLKMGGSFLAALHENPSSEAGDGDLAIQTNDDTCIEDGAAALSLSKSTGGGNDEIGSKDDATASCSKGTGGVDNSNLPSAALNAEAGPLSRASHSSTPENPPFVIKQCGIVFLCHKPKNENGSEAEDSPCDSTEQRNGSNKPCCSGSQKLNSLNYLGPLNEQQENRSSSLRDSAKRRNHSNKQCHLNEEMGPNNLHHKKWLLPLFEREQDKTSPPIDSSTPKFEVCETLLDTVKRIAARFNLLFTNCHSYWAIRVAVKMTIRNLHVEQFLHTVLRAPLCLPLLPSNDFFLGTNVAQEITMTIHSMCQLRHYFRRLEWSTNQIQPQHCRQQEMLNNRIQPQHSAISLSSLFENMERWDNLHPAPVEKNCGEYASWRKIAMHLAYDTAVGLYFMFRFDYPDLVVDLMKWARNFLRAYRSDSLECTPLERFRIAHGDVEPVLREMYWSDQHCSKFAVIAGSAAIMLLLAAISVSVGAHATGP